MRGRKQMSWVGRLAPVATIALLIGMLQTGGVDAVSGEQVDAYQSRIRRMVDAIPYKIGPWVGDDVAPPPSAVKMLKPNAILERRFVEPATGRTFSLLVVHTEEARDMQGHWPPNCYPANGWELLDTRDSTIELDGMLIPVKDYAFRRMMDGFERRMNVMGFFIVPEEDAGFLTSYKAMVTAGQRRSTAGLGAAQIQLISGDEFTAVERRELAQQFLQAIEPLIHTIAGGVDRG